MRLNFENIGKVAEANININGITVIAGENNTGKSTVGKILFSIFQTYYDLENKIFRERFNSLKELLDDGAMYSYIRQTKDFSFVKFNNIVDEHIKRLMFLFDDHRDRVVLEEDDFLLSIYKDNIKSKVDEIVQRLEITNDLLVQNILARTFREEFNKQINYIFDHSVGKVRLKIQDKDLELRVADNDVVVKKQLFDLSTEVTYIDNPLIIDDRDNWIIFEPNADITLYHSDYLRKQFRRENTQNTLEQILVSERLKLVDDIFSSVYDWQLVSSDTFEVEYDQKVDYKNLSSGLKSFYILKRLIENGVIKNKNTIILDEPEVHLHPEWQMLYAEILVILQKELGLHILINTHSPYFLNAIEVFSEKHHIHDRCFYYLAENQSNGRASIRDVTQNTVEIYKKLSRPLQILENIRYANDD